ncbi:unnamed protein product [Spirodela intermedia]|uniref:Uncharacterized protein n=1 Tax=Spirodela intermedia TaxID=51605 RepID=A0A7I8JAM2_SPIIN|nr:unnamed protein product [Spirodela intermedia]CAA6666785.1 unnamed protein product [Spirodela intermedia]
MVFSACTGNRPPALPMVLPLLAAAGHGGGQLLMVLLVPFLLKIPARRYAPLVLGDLAFSSRLFFFRLSRILFHAQPAAAGGGDGRWGRTLRLVVSGRAHGGQRWAGPDEDSLHAVSMLVL